jgi:hypothetical protein
LRICLMHAAHTRPYYHRQASTLFMDSAITIIAEQKQKDDADQDIVAVAEMQNRRNRREGCDSEEDVGPFGSFYDGYGGSGWKTGHHYGESYAKKQRASPDDSVDAAAAAGSSGGMKKEPTEVATAAEAPRAKFAVPNTPWPTAAERSAVSLTPGGCAQPSLFHSVAAQRSDIPLTPGCYAVPLTPGGRPAAPGDQRMAVPRTPGGHAAVPGDPGVPNDSGR